MKTYLLAMLVLVGTTLAFTTSASAQTPPTPSPVPTLTPTPTFNFDEVKEVVSELRGSDGRTHYVTVSEDTEGVVRVRLSLFNLPASGYSAVIFRNGDCSKSATYGAADVLGSSHFQLTEQSGLVLYFFNTRAISITAGSAASIYDADGTSLALYRPGDSGAGPVACARLDTVPGPPNTGNTVASEAGRLGWPLFASFVVFGAAAVALVAIRIRF